MKIDFSIIYSMLKITWRIYLHPSSPNFRKKISFNTEDCWQIHLWFNNLKLKCNVSNEHGFHNLRHTFLSNKTTWTAKQKADFAGHSSAKTTIDFY